MTVWIINYLWNKKIKTKRKITASFIGAGSCGIAEEALAGSYLINQLSLPRSIQQKIDSQLFEQKGQLIFDKYKMI